MRGFLLRLTRYCLVIGLFSFLFPCYAAQSKEANGDTAQSSPTKKSQKATALKAYEKWKASLPAPKYAFPSYTFRGARISGLKQTKTPVIMKALAIKVGQEIETKNIAAAVSKAERNLKDLGADTPYLTFVHVAPILEGHDLYLAVFAVDKWTLIAAPIVGYDNYTGVIAAAVFNDANLGGYGKALTVFGYYNAFKSRSGITYEDPALGFTDFTLYFRFYYTHVLNPYYNSSSELLYSTLEDQYEFTFNIGYNLPTEYPMEVLLDTYYRYAHTNVIDQTSLFDPNGRVGPPDNTFMLFAEYDLGKVFKEGYLRHGISTSFKGGASPIYHLYPESSAQISETAFWITNRHRDNFAYHFSYQFWQTDYFYPHIRGINWQEVQGNYGYELNIEYRLLLGTAGAKSVFPVSFYMPFFFDAGNANILNQPYSIAKTQDTGGVGFVLFFHRVAFPIRMDVGVNFAHLKKDPTGGWLYWSISIGDWF